MLSDGVGEMADSMKKQSILITGCSHGGIGYETAKYLKALGHDVFASVRRQEDVDRLQSEGFDAYLMDVRNEKEVEITLASILKKTNNTLDVLFNNAGFGQVGALEDIPTQYLKEQFETNVFALHYLTRAVFKIMRKQGSGKIIQHGSVLGLVSMKYRGAYNASKYAVEGMVDTMRQELIGSNISMSVLNTGPVTSNFRKNALKSIKNIDIENSVHSMEYQKIIVGQHKKVPFNKEAICVAKVVEKILNAKRPKPRYSITFFTTLVMVLKRLLSTRWMDRIFSRF